VKGEQNHALEIIHMFQGMPDFHNTKMLFSCKAKCFRKVKLLRHISDSESTHTAGCIKIFNGKCDAGQ